mmetsp:Transcript_28094/g.61331  ORF Transcript_28094/g.61331 Transcript_28094/m.61331 type:complete len:149 (+) Transcript_28094:506-952(+)
MPTKESERPQHTRIREEHATGRRSSSRSDVANRKETALFAETQWSQELYLRIAHNNVLLRTAIGIQLKETSIQTCGKQSSPGWMRTNTDPASSSCQALQGTPYLSSSWPQLKVSENHDLVSRTDSKLCSQRGDSEQGYSMNSTWVPRQ